jgi:hypothetical protein
MCLVVYLLQKGLIVWDVMCWVRYHHFIFEKRGFLHHVINIHRIGFLQWCMAHGV